MQIEWTCKAFAELTGKELYQILQARIQVFCVEQNCPYQDLDGSDEACWHLVARGQPTPVSEHAAIESAIKDPARVILQPSEPATQVLALTRLVPPGLHYPEASIGRVLTTAKARGLGLGRELMLRSITACEQLFGKVPIKIGAQQYLEKFYQGLGFNTVSEMYLEDGIPHVKMLRKHQS